MQTSQPAVSPDEAMDVNGKAGQPTVLPIADGPPTGYSWVLTLPQQVTQVQDAPAKTAVAEYRLGSSITGPLQVLAPAGEFTLQARLVRPWALDRPVRTITIHLHVS